MTAGVVASFESERVDRIEARRLLRRIKAEEHAGRPRQSRTPSPTALTGTFAGQDIQRDIPSARPKPSAMPMPPPIRLSAIASTRNCSSTSRPFAPIAMRRPISRVRSVTDTSMMFMIPMPPTISDTPAMPASSVVIVPIAAVRMSAISSAVRTDEVVVLARARSCAACGAARRSGRRPPLVSPARCRRHGDVADVGDAEQLLHHRRVRREDLVVHVRPHAALALGRPSRRSP